jgi:hypothetical protein
MKCNTLEYGFMPVTGTFSKIPLRVWRTYPIINLANVDLPPSGRRLHLLAQINCDLTHKFAALATFE